MKCDELKAYEICGEENGELHFATVYPKSAVDKAIAELKEVLTGLQEAQRWRKFSEEKPKSHKAKYLVHGSSGFMDCDTWKELPDGHWGFSFYDYGVEFWMPLPKEPEET